MRNRKFRTASYYGKGRGMSINALEAYDNGIMPVSKWNKKLGLKSDELKSILDYDSWHHTGKYAMKTDFYRLPEKQVLEQRAKNLISKRRKKFWDFVEKLAA